MRIALALALVALWGAAPAPVVTQPPDGSTVDGIPCQASEGQVEHVHAHLTILIDGRAVLIPNDVGRPAVTPCIYWLHTHTSNGIIHIESPVRRPFTLGEFFAVWGKPLTASDVAGHRLQPGEQVRAFLDGKRWHGDAAAIGLAEHTDIVIEVGPPFPKPVPFTAWNGL
ncbi:MAG TPA: hypothetical protein VNJ51_04355 [Candidatus Dormibacteraeota bacterium]|nr:hypothetical protein [Candidatus Dormibacteraeota bacterium]